MIRVLIKYVGGIAEYTGKKEEYIELKEQTRLSELVDMVREKYGIKDELIVLVNGVPARMDTLFKNGDKVSILHSISGG